MALSLAVGGGRISRPPRALALSRMMRAMAAPRSPSFAIASTASHGSVPKAPPTEFTPARTMIRASGLSSTSCAGSRLSRSSTARLRRSSSAAASAAS